MMLNCIVYELLMKGKILYESIEFDNMIYNLHLNVPHLIIPIISNKIHDLVLIVLLLLALRCVWKWNISSTPIIDLLDQ